MMPRFLPVVALAAALLGTHVSAQTTETEAGLRRDVERKFDVLPLRDGIALRPRSPMSTLRSIELGGGTIAVDGTLVTGAELREKLGADADLVIRLSYLDAERQRTLFGTPAAPDRATTSPPREDRSIRDVPPRRGGGNDRVRFGGGVRVAEDEVVNGNVVAIGGSARVDGEVRGDVVAIGGGITLGPKAVVSGNVVAVGGELQRDPGARIGGEVRVGPIGFGDWWRRMWTSSSPWSRAVGSTFTLVATLSRVTLLCLLAVLVVVFGRDYVERISLRVAAEPLKAGAIGLLAQILFFPVLIATVIMLIVTIIGIPLLVLIPFALIALVLVALVGFTAVAMQIGRVLSARMGWSAGIYSMTVAGILVVALPLLLARFAGLVMPATFGLGLIGSCIEYVAWTVGFGAVALARFDRGVTVTVAVERGQPTVNG